MMVRLNCSSTNHTTPNNVKKDKLPRKEKKAQNSLYFNNNHKLERFEVAQTDKEVSHKRKIKKHGKARAKNSRTLRKFTKAERIFNRWLAKNIDRFNVKLIKKSSCEFCFEGVTKSVTLIVNSTPEASLFFEYIGADNQYEDTSFGYHDIEYIGNESYHPQKGFYDGDRADGVYTYYPTREDLYINEVYEKIIEYCNEIIIPNNSLYLGDLDGATFGFIGSADETNNKKFQREFGLSIKLRNGLVGCDGEQLFSDSKPFKCIKYDLFDEDKEPSIRYFESK